MELYNLAKDIGETKDLAATEPERVMGNCRADRRRGPGRRDRPGSRRDLIKLKGEAKMRGVNDHPAAKGIPQTEPRQTRQNHMLEWLEAAKGGPKT